MDWTKFAVRSRLRSVLSKRIELNRTEICQCTSKFSSVALQRLYWVHKLAVSSFYFGSFHEVYKVSLYMPLIMSVLFCFQPSWSPGPGTCCRDQDQVTRRFSTPGPSNYVFRRWQHLTGVQQRCFSTAGFWEIGWIYFVTFLFCISIFSVLWVLSFTVVWRTLPQHWKSSFTILWWQKIKIEQRNGSKNVKLWC